MNVLKFKKGDIVTLTALYDVDDYPQMKLEMDEDDANIYAELKRSKDRERWVQFIQYKGNKRYQYISCRLDYDFPTQLYTIKDIKIESKNYPLTTGWGASSGLYLVESFKKHHPFVNWDKLPWGDMK